ncbi:RecA RecA-RadA recombinase [Pyrenophora tritici-repentis]|uniref:RecA bacterial DNA recombination protein n=2 Tax=Pyrenophora tritici-repentis TaxID=45151 RepID=A0A2W1GDP7_9PLEO|nr:RecA RecA-RadA recombinase [Pyrenophora tritici-repentis]KAI0588203.1 RecA RecA-RadA recombinase [Pyrenophora tritici-repentis]KAI0612141.1 RecA RecA-RadA recombinase [Pyrenophora tritici-repentis]KAI1514660.1 recA bacterial DNA recombination protein [Pyrenophora tritici-repentis]KAI1561806.1 RecA RecA RadA recombinase [Pyrenophora tritici-repentis]
MTSEEAQPSPTSHRLPTVSASQALQKLHARGARTVSTGITQLDKVLSPLSLPGHDVSGGYTRGKVTEVFGPSGVGKTAFGIQAAVSALREGQQVIWVDAACAPLVKHRVEEILTSYADKIQPSYAGKLEHQDEPDPDSPSDKAPDRVRGHFHYMALPTLAHLLALFVHPPAAFLPQNTSLVVVDSLATLVDNAYPRNVDDRTARNKTEQSRWAAGRRFAIINELIATFTKFAAVHDIALLVTSQTITRIRGASRALLVPAMAGVEWENGVSTRLVLFRDWLRLGKASEKLDADKLQRARFVGLVKANGVSLADEGSVGNVVPFTIENTGLCEMSIAADDVTSLLVPTHARPLKRHFAEVDENAPEEPKSDELYGWIEDDEVATEGLLIDEAPLEDENDAGTRLDVVADGHKKKVTRTSTV